MEAKQVLAGLKKAAEKRAEGRKLMKEGKKQLQNFLLLAQEDPQISFNGAVKEIGLSRSEAYRFLREAKKD